MTTYAQLNIGRNIGDEPMDLGKWHEFIEDAATALVYAAYGDNTDTLKRTVEVHTGLGRYIGDDGHIVVEDSAHVSLFCPEKFDLEYLEHRARKLESRYSQDMVAVIHN